tara:strand:+ start:1534 stop:2304 length:771 start_codon:yes stop_codon:yes gene_type:complete
MAYNKSPFKMKPKSPLMKALIGNQKNLNEGLKAAIQASPAKMYGKSPVKQEDTKIKDIPKVLEDTGKKVINKGKKIIKDIGNITLSSKERKACKEKGGKFKKGKCYMPESPAKAHCKSPVKQKMEMVEVNGKKVPKFAADGKGAGDLKKDSPAKGYKSAAQRKAVHASKADGGKGHPDKKKSPAKQMSKLKKSPAKKYKSPAKQAKSKKEMKYDKTAQKAENAAVSGKVRKNSRLVNRANKMNKKNNLGKGKIAKM